MLDVQPPSSPALARRQHAWMVVRLILGLAQMVGALLALTLLLLTGMNAYALTVVVRTSLCTTVSVLLFGSWRKPR
jgi:hypothetical protein